MKYHQLCESEMSIEDIYKTLENECSQFKELTDNFNYRYIPIRMIGDDFEFDEFFYSNYILNINTKPERQSLMNFGIGYKLFNDEIIEHGHASRIHHMLSTSTKGQNSKYPIDSERGARVFPIGNFKYSFVPNDFNGFFNLKIFHNMLRIEELVENSGDDINNIISNYEKHLDELDANGDNTKYFRNELVLMRQELDKIDDIKSNNYKDAFKFENEIWFNVKSYYVLSPHTMANLSELIRKNS